MRTPGRRRSWRKLALLLAATLVAWGCVLSPSPDVPSAMDGGFPSGSGGLVGVGTGGAAPSGGGAPACLLHIVEETWCSGDDLWVRATTCIQHDTWSVRPCPQGCSQGTGGTGASCEPEELGLGGIGGQRAGAP